jgi:hypothetical protein
VQIDSVEQRPADLSEIPLNRPASTPAIARRIAEKTAAAPVQITTDTNLKDSWTCASRWRTLSDNNKNLDAENSLRSFG